MNASKLKAGDVVTVRATVKWADGLYLKLNCSDGSVIAVPHADIVSIEPRPIAVGDRVRHQTMKGSLGGKVLAVHGGEACLLVMPDFDESFVEFMKPVPLSTLIRADASDE